MARSSRLRRLGQPTFRAAVTAVTTDVITRDGDGRFVSISTKDDFTVLEDGVPQTITSFALVTAGAPSPGWPRPGDDGSRGDRAAQGPSGGGDVAGRVVVIFVDDIHVEPEYTPHVKRIIEDLAQNLLHDGDLVAMLSSGPSSIATGLTYDRKLVAASARRFAAAGSPRGTSSRTSRPRRGRSTCATGPRWRSMPPTACWGDLEQVQNKRKVLLYISAGYDFDPFAEGRNSRDRIQGGRFAEPTRFLYQNQQDNPYSGWGRRRRTSICSYMRELILTANRANVSIYSVDPRGLQGVTDAGQYLDQSEWRTYIQKTQSTLRLMAEATGGFAVVNVNDFPAEFKKIDAETSDYYILGFTSSNPDVKRRVRELEVKVNRPNVNVASRKGYSLKTPGPAGDAAGALTRLRRPAHCRGRRDRRADG